MLKQFRLALIILVVLGLNSQSASACIWWNWNPFNICSTYDCCSPCYTPCRSVTPVCDPCQGFTTPMAPIPVGPTVVPGEENWHSVPTGQLPTQQYSLQQNSIPPNTVILNSPPEKSSPNIQHYVNPNQGTIPQSWYIDSNGTKTEIKPGDHLPPSAEELDSVQWKTIPSKKSAIKTEPGPSFKNVTLKSQVSPEKPQVRYYKKRTIKAPSAVAVWQHLNSVR